jgi:hypothetical protein
MADNQDEELNSKAVNANFPNSDQLRALIARRTDLLDVMEDKDDQSWVNNPNDELREALRAVTKVERVVEKQLNAASAVLKRDFEMGQD